MYDHTFLNFQIARSDSLVIAYVHMFTLIVLRALRGYVWVNSLTSKGNMNLCEKGYNKFHFVQHTHAIKINIHWKGKNTLFIFFFMSLSVFYLSLFHM